VEECSSPTGEITAQGLPRCVTRTFSPFPTRRRTSPVLFFSSLALMDFMVSSYSNRIVALRLSLGQARRASRVFQKSLVCCLRNSQPNFAVVPAARARVRESIHETKATLDYRFSLRLIRPLADSPHDDGEARTYSIELLRQDTRLG
jgi:hypothetical protein